MKFLDRIGLTKSIEIPTSFDARIFEKKLLKFKSSKKDRFEFLYAPSFIPSELTIKNGEFILSKNPRFFRPFAAVGEVRGRLMPNSRNDIEARVYSVFYLQFIFLFLSTIMVSFGIYVSREPTYDFMILWFLVLIGFNALTYFQLRYSVKRLEREFRIFMKEQIS